MVYPALLPLMRTPRAASSRLNWRPHRADLNGPVRFARKTKSFFCACAITFQMQSTELSVLGEATGILSCGLRSHIFFNLTEFCVSCRRSCYSQVLKNSLWESYVTLCSFSQTIPVNIKFPGSSVAPFRPLQWILIGISRSPRGIRLSALRSKLCLSWLIFGRCPIRISLGMLCGPNVVSPELYLGGALFESRWECSAVQAWSLLTYIWEAPYSNLVGNTYPVWRLGFVSLPKSLPLKFRDIASHYTTGYTSSFTIHESCSQKPLLL